MASPKWSPPTGPLVAAAIAAAVQEAWMGPEEGASNRFLEALRKMVGPEELDRLELLALQVFHRQPRPPEGHVAIPPSAHLQICPGCMKLRKTPFTAPQRGRIKLEVLRDADWLRSQFDAGRGVAQVAKQLGCSQSNVVRWADVHGIPTPRTQATGEFDAEVGRRHRAGDAPGAIARGLDTTVQRVRESLARQRLVTKKRGHHYFEPEWWRVRLQDRGMTKAACAKEAGILPHTANYYLEKFGLHHLVDRNRRRSRKYPQLFDASFLRDLLARHGDSYESAAKEVGCAPTLISQRARDILGREVKHSTELPHSDPTWWRSRLDAGATTLELADEAGVQEKTARERIRVLGWLADAYRNNAARERARRSA